MRRIVLAVLAVTVLPVIVPAGPTRAQTLAEVGGVPITLDDVLTANPAARDDATLRNQVLVELVDRQAVLNEASRLGIEKTPEYADTMKQDQESLLIRMMVARFNEANPVTETELEAAYERAFDKPYPKQYRLREILVESYGAAEDIISALKAGKSFSILAAAKSQDDATAALGGELGWQAATSLQAPILKAVETMKVEEVAGPISIAEGYVVIQLLGERPSPKPTLDQVRPQLIQAIQQQAWNENVIKLRTAQGAHLIAAPPGP